MNQDYSKIIFIWAQDCQREREFVKQPRPIKIPSKKGKSYFSKIVKIEVD